MFYVYDGTFEGFLTATAELFRSERGAGIYGGLSGVCRESEIRPMLPFVHVRTDEGICGAFGGYLLRHFGRDMPECVYRAFLSGLPGIEDAIVGYIRLSRSVREDPIGRLQDDCVRAVAGAARRTGREAHRYTGLLRFRRLTPLSSPRSDSRGAGHPDSGVYFAEFEPETDCLPLLGDHFAVRFAGLPFMIADRRRSRCLIHPADGEWSIAGTGPELAGLAVSDTFYEELWKKYFKCLAIPDRIDPALQASNMPKKYWKYLVEKPAGTGSG